MVSRLRHHPTKGVATVETHLRPPRHIPTSPYGYMLPALQGPGERSFAENSAELIRGEND